MRPSLAVGVVVFALARLAAADRRVALVIDGLSDQDRPVADTLRASLATDGVLLVEQDRARAARSFATTKPADPLDDAAVERLRRNLRVDRAIVIEMKPGDAEIVDVAWVVADQGRLARDHAQIPRAELGNELSRRFRALPAITIEHPTPPVAVAVAPPPIADRGDEDDEEDDDDDEDDETPHASFHLFGGGAFATEDLGFGGTARAEIPVTDKVIVGLDGSLLYKSESAGGYSADVTTLPIAGLLGYKVVLGRTEVTLRGGAAFVYVNVSSQTSLGTVGGSTTAAAGVAGANVILRGGSALGFLAVDIYVRDGSFVLLTAGGGL